MSRGAYLGDAEPSPLFLPEQLERASRPIKVLLWYLLQHLLWQLHVAVFEIVIVVPAFAEPRSANCPLIIMTDAIDLP